MAYQFYHQEKKLVGIVTNRDLRFEKNNKKSIKSVMTSSSLITSTKNVSLSEAETILQKNKIEKLPIVNSNNELIGLITFRDIIKVKKQPNACKDNYGRLRGCCSNRWLEIKVWLDVLL